MTEAAIVENPEEIAKKLRAFSRSAAKLSSEQAGLIKKYPDKWVGVYNGNVCAISDDVESLVEKMDERNIPRGEYIVRFISRNQKTLIL